MIRAISEKPTSAAIFQGNVESANNPKAAPRFSTCVMWNNPGMTVRLSCKGMYVATAHLERRSSTMTDTAMRKKYLRMEKVEWGNSFVLKSKTLNRLSCIMPMLDAVSRAKESRVCTRRGFNLRQHRTTALANRRIRFVFAHVRRIVPATLAFHSRRFSDLDQQGGVTVACFRLLQHYVGYDEQVTQLIAVA